MRVFYIDPGLRDDLGHHANSARLIVAELRRRGIDTPVLTHDSVTDTLRQELTAFPMFRHFTYATIDSDPIAGWLSTFDQAVTLTLDDLSRLPPMSDIDIVFINSAQAAQLMAVLQWMLGLPRGRVPHVVLEFGLEVGVDVQPGADGPRIEPRDPRVDPRAVLYRLTAKLLPLCDRSRLHLVTFEPMSSLLYQCVLGYPVNVLPQPRFARAACGRSDRRKPLTVAMLGQQRVEKGFALVPDIVRQLLARRGDVRVLVHNGAPVDMPDIQQQLRFLAQVEPRLSTDERVAGPPLWTELLDRSDLIVCPYQPWRFVGAYSAVAAEAIAHGIPLVVPAETTLSTLLSEYSGPGTTFATHDAASVVAAIDAAIERYDDLARLASIASATWNATNGAAPMVDAILRMIADGVDSRRPAPQPIQAVA